MREILFRGKRIDNGEWVEGNIVWSNDSEQKYRSIIIPNDKSNMFLSSDEADLGFENWNLVDSETISQYTGLPDKNGRKIFEGDIVQDYPFKAVVKFGEFEGQVLKNIGFNLDWLKDFSYRQDLLYWVNKIEVIGNIFDNPELLKI